MTTLTEHGRHDHGHAHPHGEHVHEGPPVVESRQHHGPSHDGTVVLDIGEGIGAVVLHVPERLAGVEVDIAGTGPGTISTHSLVRPRVLPGGPVYAAVYPGLPAGAYVISATAGLPATAVEVHGGQVAEVDWRVP